MLDPNQMPGLIPALFDPALRFHAVQITIFENAGPRGRQVKASVKAKFDRSESWNDCALDQIISLQGRGRDSRRAMHLLSETCLRYGEIEARDFVLARSQQLRTLVAEQAGARNPRWRDSYLRTGFGRERAQYIAGRTSMKPLNPGVIACYDGGSQTFGIQLGEFQRVERLDGSITERQKARGVVAYSLWLLDAPEYTQDGTETACDRFERFRQKQSCNDREHITNNSINSDKRNKK